MSDGQKSSVNEVTKQIIDMRFRLIHLQLIVENLINRNISNPYVVVPSQGEIKALEEKAVDLLISMYPGMVERDRKLTPDELQEELADSMLEEIKLGNS
jgi:hypothetical protein